MCVCVSVYSLGYTACNAIRHIAIRGLPLNKIFFPHYLLNGMIAGKR
jgi:hypothetical protein